MHIKENSKLANCISKNNVKILRRGVFEAIK